MNEKKYEVLDSSNYVLGRGMTLETALLLIKACCVEYYNEPADYRIREMEAINCAP